MSQSHSPHSLTGVLDQTVEETDGEKVSLDDILDSFGKRTFGPVLLILGLIALSPIGAIPGMSIALGTLIVLIAVQILLAQDHPWLPNRILRMSFERKRLTRFQKKAEGWTRWLDRFMGRRLEFLASGPMVYPLAVIIIGLAVLFYPLALIPFGVMAPAAAIVMLSLALTARDGLLTGIGLLTTGLSIWLMIRYWPF